MRDQICEMCETRPANCGLIDIVNQETVFLCYHCAEKLEDIHERLWGHVVRCKDCIWWHECRTKDKFPFKKDSCNKFGTKMNADDFCSRGERE